MDYHDSNAYFTQQLTAQNPYSQNPRRGTMASQNGLSDLDSGPASLPIMPMSVASNHSSSSSKPRQPPAKFKLDLPNSRPTTPAGTYLVSISLFSSPQMTFFPTLLCTRKVETVQDFLSKLGMKPCLYLVEISFFFTRSCHHQTYQNHEQS